ncbi:carotenoid 1,2-hydratase [Shewanella sp. JM162201]|uniref:Carotenoid 1,2-hydratase n=1 Tax=Shewanella jiangmenensis TaxID=2837387 RepID=A0ABS5V1H8_9GAMM|nr:lipocalin-like domain-containing protein [Shewanella jiangmenensis]MBT1443765.1 carotenoid 1,2-hydratase [Shewanella jiangmenensis]
MAFCKKIKTLPLMLPIMLLLALLSGCGEPVTTQTQNSQIQDSSGMGELMSGDITGFDKVKPTTALSFPADHGPHNNFRQEWWYLTANLTTASGEPLGLQWTQFRVALKPLNPAPEQEPDPALNQAAQSDNSWQSRQLWFAHAAVTRKNSHIAAERWSRGHGALAGAGGSPFAVYLSDWRWQSQTEALFPASLAVAHSGDKGTLAYRLNLSSSSPLQLQGDKGYSAKSADAGLASHYYSAPFIHIEGEVLLDGSWQQVRGQGWLDREWSSAFLGLKQQGWDWFALRLDDGSALMLFALREQNAKSFTHANRMWPDGRSQKLEVISMSPSDYHQGYPVAWQLNLKDKSAGENNGTGSELNLKVEALNPDARMALSMQYWEGPVRISRGDSKSDSDNKGDIDSKSDSHIGEGYMELTGY